MGLLNPGALVFLALVPALVLAYLARERSSRVTVSSVLAFRALRALGQKRFAGRPRFDWRFFLELLVLTLAVLAMAGPYVVRRENPIAVVLDNSAQMKAQTASGGSRFDKAKKELDAMLAAMPGESAVSVYLTSPEPHRVNAAPLSIAAARSAVRDAQATDAPADNGALVNLLTELSSDSHYAKVIFAGARALAPPVPPGITAITVGDPIENFAIGSFVLRRESFGSQALRASVTVANFSTAPKTLKVAITADGKSLASAESNVRPGETAALDFPSLAPAAVYQAVLAPSDGFSLDNVAYATSASVKSVSILFVSPTPDDAKGLGSIPGVSVTTVAPDAFSPGELASADLAIFEYSVPKEMPSVNALLVMPPPGDPVFHFDTVQVRAAQVTAWRATDPLAYSVNFRLLNPGAGEAFGVHPWMAPVVDGRQGALVLRGERDGHRFVASGFNLFPYLGRQNLPMSILTLNILGYLAGVGANSGGYRTGQPWLVPAGIESVILPSGQTVAAKPGTLFDDTASLGVYKLVGRHGAVTLRAVNFSDLADSDLLNATPLRIESHAPAPKTRAVTAKAPLTLYLFAAILVLLALEGLVVYRRRSAAGV
jgi:hypothetical protein